MDHYKHAGTVDALPPEGGTTGELRHRFIRVCLALMQSLDRELSGSQSRTSLAILDCEEANYRTAVLMSSPDAS